MIHVTLALPDDVGETLAARARDGGYDDLAGYVRALIDADVDVDDGWPEDELLAALEEGERSGISPRSLDEIFAEARAQYAASR